MNGTIGDIQVDPTNAQIACVVRPSFDGSSIGHVWRTANAGATWTDISGNLPDIPCNAIALQSTGAIYVGTDVGVYVTTNLGASWSQFGTGLANATVLDLEINETTGILAAGTHGRSMWTIRSSCVSMWP